MSAGSAIFCYDLNGNMTQRIEGSDTYTFAYDDENRLVTGAKNGVTLASYTYDGDGKRVKAQEGGFTTYYIGDYYEWREGPTTTAVKYYYAAGQRIAMRKAGTLTWLLGDHLGSATITATENGTLASEQKYTAWGQTRSGSVGTDRQYTGQISEPQLGIYFYNARYYDSYLNRWLQPDSIVPDPYNILDYDRYSYARNNPVRYNDPSGHYVCSGYNEDWGEKDCYDIVNNWLDFLYKNGGKEGKQIIEDFMKADAAYPILFEFLQDLGGAWMQTVSIKNEIRLLVNSGTATNYTDQANEAAAFGHELFHLIRQSSSEQGLAQAEKEAYDFQAKIMQNMGIDYPENSPVSVIAPLGTSKKDLELVAYYSGSMATPTFSHILIHGLIGDPIGRALIVSWESVTGCYGSVCFAPGGQDYQYKAPAQ